MWSMFHEVTLYECVYVEVRSWSSTVDGRTALLATRFAKVRQEHNLEASIHELRKAPPEDRSLQSEKWITTLEKY